MRSLRQLLAYFVLFSIAFTATLFAQGTNPHARWKLLTPSISGAPGSTVEVKVEVSLVPKAHIYSSKTNGASPTEITVGEAGTITLGGRVKTNRPPVRNYDENFEDTTEYWNNGVTFIVPVKISPKARPGSAEGWVNFYYMTCDDSRCIPPTDEKLTFKITVTADTATAAQAPAETALVPQDMAPTEPQTALTTEGADTAATGIRDTETVATTGTGSDSGSAAAAVTGANGGDQEMASTGGIDDIERAKSQGLWAFLALAMLSGFGALLTPCVFPMIPITVSFFTKRKQTTRKRSIRDASLYAFGIILTFSGIGLLFAILFKAAGVTDFATNPFVNLGMAAIFVILALSLFGMYEIQVPTSVLNRLNRTANDQGDSVGGVMLMGLVFSLTSFTCTVPFVGGLLNMAAKGDWLWPLMGMAAFSAVFSFPFFLLALFPALLKSMPKSGGWLNSVKIVMGFLELAAAIKFISNADLVWQWGVLTREMFLAIWISIATITALYLLGRIQFPHDSPVERISPIRALLSMSFMAIGFWLLTGLFGGRLGEIDSFIAPQEYPGKGNTSVLASLMPASGTAVDGAPGATAQAAETWIEDDYEKALEIARKEGKPIFIDFTGYTCTNCRWMERNMFTRQDVSARMKEYVLLRLYTDGRKPIHKKNRQIQVDRFHTVSLPYYALVAPSDSVIAKFDGMTREPEQFLGFLKKGLGDEATMALK